MLRGNPWTVRTPGRRSALTGASAAVLCLGAILAGCGSGDGNGGSIAMDRGPDTSAAPARPTEGVTLVPLAPPERKGPAQSPKGAVRGGSPEPGPGHSGAPTGAVAGGGTPTSAVAGASGVNSPAPGASSPAPDTDPPAESAGSPAPAPSTAAPAALTWDPPVRADTDRRWCEDVAFAFHNSGGSAVRSGTVEFGTHVIGALGVDWATVVSTVDLPTPIGAGARVTKTWTVCVDAWRVPLGMHVETRDVTVRWK